MLKFYPKNKIDNFQESFFSLTFSCLVSGGALLKFNNNDKKKTTRHNIYPEFAFKQLMYDSIMYYCVCSTSCILQNFNILFKFSFCDKIKELISPLANRIQVKALK